MHTFFNPNAPFLSWQQFLKRPDNIGLNVMQAKQKYLTEQTNYYRMMQPGPMNMTAVGGAGSTSTDTGPVLLLDIAGATTDIVGGWSLRKLTSAYTGAPVRVIRTADSAEQDISFTSDGYINEDELTTFADGGVTEVIKWYDQSGTDNHLIPPSATARPRTTDSSGNVFKNGDFLYIQESSRQYLRLTNTLGSSNFGPRSVLALNYFSSTAVSPIWRINKNAGNQIQRLGPDTSNNDYITLRNRTTAGVDIDYASTRVVDATSFNLFSSILRPSPDETEIYHKGDKIISESAIPNFDFFFDFNTPEAGSSGNASDPTEVIVYSTDQLANVRVAMENNINTYYSLS